ncbi:YbaN family protein [Enterococcus sp. LJL98]
MKRILFLFLGCVTFTLGTIGIFLPFLPTTGFYLATSYLWLRSSDKLYQRFIHSKYYQMYIVDLLIKKNISTKGMVKMFVMMGIVFALSIIMVPMLYLKWLLGFIYFAHVVGLTWYFKIHPQKIKLEQTKKDLENS